MGTKKRVAVAASVAGMAGAAAGLTASHLGLEADESTKIGCAVASMVGEFLLQVLRFLSGNEPDAETSSAARAEDASAEEAGDGDTEVGSDDTINASGDSVDTGTASTGNPKRPKHRKQRRASRRRGERRQERDQGTEQDNSSF